MKKKKTVEWIEWRNEKLLKISIEISFLPSFQLFFVRYFMSAGNFSCYSSSARFACWCFSLFYCHYEFIPWTCVMWDFISFDRWFLLRVLVGYRPFCRIFCRSNSLDAFWVILFTSRVRYLTKYLKNLNV